MQLTWIVTLEVVQTVHYSTRSRRASRATLAGDVDLRTLCGSRVVLGEA